MRFRIPGCNAPCRLQKSIERFDRRQVCAAVPKCLNDSLCRNISDERVLCEGTSAQAPNGRIETPAASIVGRDYLVRRLLRTAVQVYTNLEVIVFRPDSLYEFRNLLRSREPHRVR